MKLHRVIRAYTTVGGAEVQLRRYLWQTPLWQCTGCTTWGNAGDLHQNANDHASTCRARPRTFRRKP